MSSEPTLEEIAANGTVLTPGYPTVLDSVLARELIALREFTVECIRDCHTKLILDRLTALEQQSRGYAEDGALAAGRGAGDCSCRDDHTSWCLVGRLEAAERERDALRDSREGIVATAQGQARRASEMQAQRDSARRALNTWRDRALPAEHQRDTARAALRKYAKHAVNCDGGHPSGHYACTCGLTQALAAGEANEGSGE